MFLAWGNGSDNRVFSLQAWGSEFKPQNPCNKKSGVVVPTCDPIVIQSWRSGGEQIPGFHWPFQPCLIGEPQSGRVGAPIFKNKVDGLEATSNWQLLSRTKTKQYKWTQKCGVSLVYRPHPQGSLHGQRFDGQHKENFLVFFGDVLSHNISSEYLFFVCLVDFF